VDESGSGTCQLVSTKHKSLATSDVNRQFIVIINMKQTYISVYLFILFYFILFGELNNTCSHVLFRGHASVRTPNLYGIVSTSLTLFEEVLYFKKSKSVVALSYIPFCISVSF